jgi:aryl-alcohol dehydrogenase-like predicted oxidoreductase
MTMEPAPSGDWMRHLPNGKAISALGFGCSSVWAKPGYDEVEAQALLTALVEEGVNHFDTGPSYGEGTGETRLGRFLAGRGGAGDLVVSTKVGTNLVDGRVTRGFDRDLIERSFAGSLERLGVGHVDILYLHGPMLEDLVDGAPVFDFFAAQKAAGRITYSGVNSFVPEVLERVAATPIDGAMLQYNAGDFRNARALSVLTDAGKFVTSATVLSRAKFDLRTFLPRDRASLWYLLRMLRKEPDFIWSGLRLRRRLRATGLEPTEAAIRFVTSHPLILSSLFGTSKIAHARANARAGHGTLDPAKRARLDLYAR